jgi:hypothetical protein
MDELLYIETRFTEEEIRYYDELSSIRLDGIRRTNHTKALIEAFGPYRFFITVSFNLGLSKRQAYEYGGKFVRRLTKKVVYKRWKVKGMKPLTGIVVMETADVIRRAKRKFGGWHLHMLVHDHPSLPRDDDEALNAMTDAYWKSAERLWVRGVKRKGRKPKDVQLVQKTKPDRKEQDRAKANADALMEDQKKVQLVTHIEGLCDYLSKECWKPEWDWADRFYYLGIEGIQSNPDLGQVAGIGFITPPQEAGCISSVTPSSDSGKSSMGRSVAFP